jgi:hypothetical protein
MITDIEFLDWVKQQPEYIKKIMRAFVSAYIEAGATEEEACRMAEMDYLDYSKCSTNFLLGLGVDKNALCADASIEEHCKALGF